MVVCILAGSIEYELMTKIFGKPNVYLWRSQKNAGRINMDGVFDLGEHFGMMDGWKSRRIVCRSMKLKKDTILEQGRVLKSDSHVARASLILIFEIYWRWFAMVCKPTEETGLVSQSHSQSLDQKDWTITTWHETNVWN